MLKKIVFLFIAFFVFLIGLEGITKTIDAVAFSKPIMREKEFHVVRKEHLIFGELTDSCFPLVHQEKYSVMQCLDRLNVITYFEGCQRSGLVSEFLEPGDKIDLIITEGYATIQINNQTASIPMVGIGCEE